MPCAGSTPAAPLILKYLIINYILSAQFALPTTAHTLPQSMLEIGQPMFSMFAFQYASFTLGCARSAVSAQQSSSMGLGGLRHLQFLIVPACNLCQNAPNNRSENLRMRT